jgi:hypothetical protein
MNNRTAVAAALALLAFTAASPARATPITVDFSVTSGSNGIGDFYAPGIVGAGYFTFDDSLIPTGGSGSIGHGDVVPLIDLSFEWFGASFDETSAGVDWLTFADGSLTEWLIGGSFITPGCPAGSQYRCVSGTGAQPDFTMRSYDGISFNDGVHYGIGRGTVTWSVRPTSVPEPAPLALMSAGLLAAWCFRRKQRQGVTP